MASGQVRTPLELRRALLLQHDVLDDNDGQLQLIWVRVAQVRTYLEGESQI